MLKQLAYILTLVGIAICPPFPLSAQTSPSDASLSADVVIDDQANGADVVSIEECAAQLNDRIVYSDEIIHQEQPSCEDFHCCGSSWLSGFYVDGWIEQGYTMNPDNPTFGQNGPIGFNDRANEYLLDQLYLALGKRVDTNPCTWEIGGRVDLLYGTDYYFTTAIGLETRQDGSPKWNSSDGPRGSGGALYGLAMPQAYAEVSAPLGNGLNIKLGHFYTTLGYESVMAPENFFYSHSYSKLYGEPFTHTGMLCTYEVSPRLTVHGGLTRGWNTWEDPNDTLAGLAGFTWRSHDNLGSIAFALHSGKENAFGNRTAYSLILTRQLTDRLGYTLQHDLGVQENGAAVGINRENATWYSINQYLFYQLTDSTMLGMRVEWFRDEDSTRVFTAAASNQVDGNNYGEVSLGLNWKPTPRIAVRPEVRWDFSDVEIPGLGIGGMYDDFTEKQQFTAAVDLILRY